MNLLLQFNEPPFAPSPLWPEWAQWAAIAAALLLLGWNFWRVARDRRREGPR